MGHGDNYVEQNYPIECNGRNAEGEKVCNVSINATIKIYKSPGSNTISSQVICPYITGGHGQRCKMSHPHSDKVGDGVNCPYSFDIPYAFDKK